MSTTPPGWYPDSERPGGVRWWDGSQWTDQRQGPPAASAEPTKAPRWAVVTTWVLLLGFVAGGYALCSRSSGAVDTDLARLNAYTACQEAVKQRLASPGSAKFPDDDEVIITSMGGDAFSIVGHVDSQNGFGALLRSNYTCNATATTESGSATVESIGES